MTFLNKISRSVSIIGMTAILAASPAFADAIMGPDLAEELLIAQPAEQLQVIVSFEGSDPVTSDEVSSLQAIGVSGLFFQELPMAGILATPDQIEAIADMDGVRSIYKNSEVTLSNGDARNLTGVNRLQADSNMRTNMGLPYSGKGIGILINDSGIDATHPDLTFGEKVVQNAFGTTNLNAWSGLLPVSYTEGVPDTDIGSGHGTHVAATAAGTGAASGGEHMGVAQGADLIGYGSGGVILVLDTLGGLDYALVNQFKHNIRVVNNSWGQGATAAPFDPNNPTAIATKLMADRGIINVFAAGNDGAGEATIGGTFHKAPWVVLVGAGEKDGTLVDFSSRGLKGAGGDVEIDGEMYTWEDRPNIVAPGVDIVSALANTGTLGYTDLRTPDYAGMQGTSMAAPHVAGIVAIMLEANPMLTWQEIITILEDTATNMPGREAWEVGAGYVNTHAAVMMAAEMREDFGATQTLNRTFNASVEETRITGPRLGVDFSPVGANEGETFYVEPGLSTVLARATVDSNTVAIVLVDPNGKRYGSGIALPVLGETIAVTAPAVAGTWTIKVGGIGSVSGVALDPLGVTNGTALPGTVDVAIDFNRIDGFSGIDDTAGHPAAAFIERAVSERLLDANADGFSPDADLTRAELADFLTLGGGIRQFRDSDGSSSFMDVADGIENAAAEAVTARGASLKDMRQVKKGVMTAAGNGMFDPSGNVSRAELAYSLVQALGMQDAANAAKAELEGQAITVGYNDSRIALEDDGDIPADLRGYVQLALDLQLMRASYSMSQGPFDMTPTIHASFNSDTNVTRGSYAFNAVNLFDRYK